MNDIKCPFCQQELRPLAIGWCCDCGFCADKELWQRLIRTRKALKIIKKEFHKETMPDFAVIRDALKGVGNE